MRTRLACAALAAAVAAAGCASSSEEEDIAVIPAPAAEAETDTVAYQPQRDTAVAAADTARVVRVMPMPGVDARVDRAEDPDTSAVAAEADVDEREIDVDADAAVAAGRTLQLAPVGGVDAGGTVTLREMGTQEVEVVIDATGSAIPAQGFAAVYRGTCDAPGTVVEALQNVGAETAMRSTTVLQLPLSQLMTADHIVIVRGDAAGQAAPVACVALVPVDSAGSMDHSEH